MSIAAKATQGFFHFLGRNVLSRLMGLVAMVFLARKLSPYEFGLVSITQVLLSIITVFATSGISEFLLAYRKEDSPQIFKSAFWFNIILALAVAGMALLVMPFWASTHQDERIYSLGLLVIGSYLMSQLQSIPKALLSKNLEFKKQVRVQSVFIFLLPIGKIIAVFSGLGVYSLVVPTIILLPVETFFLYRISGFRPGLKLFANRWKEIFRFTRHYIGNGIIGVLTTQGDKLILAKFMSLEALGVYNMAWELSNFFTSNVVSVSNNILNSTLPKIAHDLDKLAKKYFSFLKIMITALGPVFVPFALCAPELFNLVYGPKWDAAVLPFQILCVYAFFRSFTSSYGSIMNTMHVPHKALIMNAFYTPAHLIGSLIGIQFGVVGLAISVTLVKLLFIQWGVLQSMQAIEQKFKAFYANIGQLLMVTGITALILASGLALYRMQVQWPDILVIALFSVLSLFIFFLGMRWKYREVLLEVGEFIRVNNARGGRLFHKLLFI